MLDIAIQTGSGPRWTLLHGFTQTGRVWQEIALELVGSGREVLALDLPGHGPASRHPELGLSEAAQLVATTAGRGTYVGYSLGARVALHLAAQAPDVVQALVLVGARVGLATDAEREKRRHTDELLAQKIDTLGVAGWIDEWLALAFNQRVPPERQYRPERLLNQSAGLAASLRNCGLGAQHLSDDDLGSITTPTLVVVGSEDLPGVKEDGQRLVRVMPNATLHTVEGAGHAVPWELTPDRFARMLGHYAPDPT